LQTFSQGVEFHLAGQIGPFPLLRFSSRTFTSLKRELLSGFEHDDSVWTIRAKNEVIVNRVFSRPENGGCRRIGKSREPFQIFRIAFNQELLSSSAMMRACLTHDSFVGEQFVELRSVFLLAYEPADVVCQTETAILSPCQETVGSAARVLRILPLG